MLRKVLGFLLGFCGSLLLISFYCYNAHIRVAGPGVGVLCIIIGRYSSRLFARPTETLLESTVKVSNATAGVRGRTKRVWWSLERRLRGVIVAGVVWMLVAYFMQDSYDPNYKVVFLPASAIALLYIGQRFLVEQRG